jgi:hypothetical protein
MAVALIVNWLETGSKGVGELIGRVADDGQS